MKIYSYLVSYSPFDAGMTNRATSACVAPIINKSMCGLQISKCMWPNKRVILLLKKIIVSLIHLLSIYHHLLLYWSQEEHSVEFRSASLIVIPPRLLGHIHFDICNPHMLLLILGATQADVALLVIPASKGEYETRYQYIYIYI